MRYFSKVIEEIKNKKGIWGYLRIGIYQIDTPENSNIKEIIEMDPVSVLKLKNVKKVGEYIRNYSCYGNETFFPFKQGDKWFALYSEKYTCTSVMELPSCKKISGEPQDSFGFCPVGYYVPWDNIELKEEGIEGTFGFVSGCIWGDDHSWKLEYLDLSDIKNGNIKRENKFGYFELPNYKELKDCISFDYWCYDKDNSNDSDRIISLNGLVRYDFDSSMIENTPKFDTFVRHKNFLEKHESLLKKKNDKRKDDFTEYKFSISVGSHFVLSIEKYLKQKDKFEIENDIKCCIFFKNDEFCKREIIYSFIIKHYTFDLAIDKAKTILEDLGFEELSLFSVDFDSIYSG